MPIKKIGRKHGFNDASFYKWRPNLAGIDFSEVKRLRELELENGKLTPLLAEAHLDIHALNSVFGTKRKPHKSIARRLDAWCVNTKCPIATPAPLWGCAVIPTAMRARPMQQ